MYMFWLFFFSIFFSVNFFRSIHDGLKGYVLVTDVVYNVFVTDVVYNLKQAYKTQQ